MVVHVRLQARIDAKLAAGVVSPAFRGLTTQAKIVQSVVALVGLGLTAWGFLYYGIALLLSSAVHFRDLAGAAAPEAVASSMNSVGRRALVVSLIFTCLLIAAVWRG